jgi:hypothetical protein
LFAVTIIYKFLLIKKERVSSTTNDVIFQQTLLIDQNRITRVAAAPKTHHQ